TSSKWMRSAYGEKLRTYFAKYNPLTLIELGPGVFDSATVDTNILFIEKTKCANVLQITNVCGKDDFSGLALSPFSIPPKGAAWVNKSKAEISVGEKIGSCGTPLRDWDVKINLD